jgi:hypothetical protein
MRQALEALENGKRVRAGEGGTKYQPPLEDSAITALRAALEQQEIDWSLLEATQSSLRDHMAEIRRLRAALAQEEQPADAEAALRLALAQRDWAFKQLMAQEEQEPVAHCNYPHCQSAAGCVGACAKANRPPRREWRGLTEEELRDALRECPHDTVENLRVRWLYAKDFARAIEAALKEKNHG